MANPLTGDFEAVLQVSSGTINRLLASIHQNHGIKNDLPQFRHSVPLRVGDATPIDGMRGTLWAQASVPRIELIHGSTDRFRLEFAVRARYIADPDTTPLPELIHGTVRAEYQMVPIDPQCFGWRTLAADYLWFRVIGRTVSFTGTAVNDSVVGGLVEIVDQAAIDARITKLVRRLLETEFTPTPHKVTSARFRRGMLLSLNLGVQRSLVAVPVSLGGGQPQGNIQSITQDALEGSDFAIAIAGEAIAARVQSYLDQLKASFATQLSFKHRTYIDLGDLGDLDVLTVDITWSIKLASASAQWAGGAIPFLTSSAGAIVISLKCEARTQKKLFNVDADAIVVLELVFDAANERFNVVLKGTPVVNITGPLAGEAAPYLKPQLSALLATQIEGALKQLGNQLSLKKAREDMVQQLTTLDPSPTAQFDEVVYSPAGLIVRGRVYLSPRRPPVALFDMTPDKRGFSAFESWIPGGRIDSLEWSWSWWDKSSPPGTAIRTDRFLLRRPRPKKTKFGALTGLTDPLPGLDGSGRVCLTIKGVRVHPITGELVPVDATTRCAKFGLDIQLRPTRPDRLFLREWQPGPRDPIGPVAESVVVEVGSHGPRDAGVNTLVIFVGEEWTEEDRAALRDGLVASQRRDAGLLVLALYRDGVLGRRGAELMRDLAAYGSELEAPLFVNEDVYGTWSKTLGVDLQGGSLEWRLVTPTGGISWAHRGRLTARDLATTLDGHLFRSVDPVPVAMENGIAAGARVSAWKGGLLADLVDYLTACPAPPVGVRGIESVVVFAQKNALLSEGMSPVVGGHQSDDDTPRFRAIVVDGLEMREADAIRPRLPDDVVVIPDAHGLIAQRFGIRMWPTTVTVNPQGIVSDVFTGRATEIQPQKPSEAS